jgi:hypothetical protein
LFKEFAMLFLSRILAVSLSVLSSVALAAESSGGGNGGIDINLNNNAAQFQFSAAAGEMAEGADLHAGLLYNDLNNVFIDAGLLAKGPESGGGEGGPIIAIGAKAIFGMMHEKIKTTVTDSGSAIAVGGEIGFAVPEAPVAVIGEFYGSPKIMTFADAERFSQYSLRLEITASPQAKIYFAYREIGFGIKQVGSIVLDSGAVVGLKASF